MTNSIDPFTSVERLRKLADIIERFPERFDMESWATQHEGDLFSSAAPEQVVAWDMLDVQNCGKTCCVGGWSVALWGSELSDDYPYSWTMAGAQLLGLNHDQATDLFAGHQKNDDMPERLRRWADCIEEGIDPLDYDRANGLDSISQLARLAEDEE